MCFKTYLNHPVHQKTSRKKRPKGDHSFPKKRGGGPARYDHDHRFNGFFLKPSLRYFFSERRKSHLFLYFFGLKSMSLPREILEQCRLCPAKLWSNADFAPQNHRPFVLCPTKPRRLCSLPRKIMEQCRLCSAKSWRHSFRGQQLSSN